MLLLFFLLFFNKVFGTSALLLELDAVLYVLIFEQNTEELNQVEQEEKEYRNYYNNKETGAGLQIIKHLANARNAEGIFTHNFRFVYGKRVGRGVVITFGGEYKIAAAVIDFVNSMGIKHALAVDNGPVGDDVISS